MASAQPLRQKGKGYGHTQSLYGRWTKPNHHTVGRQDPTGKQRPSPGRQRPSPTRAPTYTSKRVGISQGDLPHTREAASVSRMHGNHKEQHLSHSLNRWKERPALGHRHAGMSRGSEPYTLRGILSKGVQALMTRLGPFPERGPGIQPHIGPIIVSFQFAYITKMNSTIHMLHFIDRAVAQCYEYNSTICSNERRQSPTSVMP